MKNNSGCKPVVFPKESKFLVHIGTLQENKTAGGIILTEKNVHEECYKKTQGKIVEIAHPPKDDEQKCGARIGDTLRFRPYSGIHIVGDDGEGYRLIEGYEIHSMNIN